MLEMEYPVAPMILGLILGNMLDTNLRRALVISEGDILQFISRPICIVLILFIVLTLVSKTKWFRATMELARININNILFKRG